MAVNSTLLSLSRSRPCLPNLWASNHDHSSFESTTMAAPSPLTYDRLSLLTCGPPSSSRSLPWPVENSDISWRKNRTNLLSRAPDTGSWPHVTTNLWPCEAISLHRNEKWHVRCICLWVHELCFNLRQTPGFVEIPFNYEIIPQRSITSMPAWSTMP